MLQKCSNTYKTTDMIFTFIKLTKEDEEEEAKEEETEEKEKEQKDKTKERVLCCIVLYSTVKRCKCTAPLYVFIFNLD